MERYSVTKGRAKVYRIVLEDCSGWADLTIEGYSSGGSLKTVSDFGDYSAIWTNIGPAKTFEGFLCELRFEYFMEKTSIHPYLIFDLDSTVNDTQRDILRFRKENLLDRQKARCVYDKLKSCLEQCFENAEDYLDFLDEIEVSKVLQVEGLYDYNFPVSHKYDEQCLAFWETIWPCFCDVLKKEIKLRQSLFSLI